MASRRSLTAVTAALLAGLLAALAVSGAAAGTPRRAPRAGRLTVGVEVLHFAAAGRTLRATGLVTAQLTDAFGHRTVGRQVVALTAATGGRCKVLHLFLNELSLDLLGLHAHLDKVQLDITGDAAGGALGSLFCKLSRAKFSSDTATRAAAARMTTAVRRNGGHAVRFTARLQPVAQAAAAGPTCSVLDLVVGPLNLQLLGLVVDLNRVHLVVTATRGQGALGDLFCKLADNAPAPTTT